MKYYLIFLLVMSILTCIIYGLDKHAAKTNNWRTPERRLLLFGFFGGALGALTGMQIFHHKTKKPRFWIINILGLIWQVAFCIYLYRN